MVIVRLILLGDLAPCVPSPSNLCEENRSVFIFLAPVQILRKLEKHVNYLQFCTFCAEFLRNYYGKRIYIIACLIRNSNILSIFVEFVQALEK